MKSEGVWAHNVPNPEGRRINVLYAVPSYNVRQWEYASQDEADRWAGRIPYGMGHPLQCAMRAHGLKLKESKPCDRKQ